MPKSLSYLLSFTLASAVPTCVGAALLSESQDFVTAQQALADGLPGVAALKAERLLAQNGWTQAETNQLATFAAEAWTRAEEGAAVLRLVEAYELEDETFWKAEGLTLAGQWHAAIKVLSEKEDAPHPPRTSLLLAQLLAAVGEYAAARTEVEPLLQSTDAQLLRQAKLLTAEIGVDEGRTAADMEATGPSSASHYLRIRTLLQEGKTQAATSELQALLQAPGTGERIRHSAELLRAELLLAQHSPEAAQEQLIKFLDATDESSVWPEAFDLLDRVHSNLPTPRLLPEAPLRWLGTGNTAQQSPEPTLGLTRLVDEFRGHALYTVARWLAAEQRRSEALGLLEALLQSQPEHPRTRDALRMAMALHAREGADARVLQLATLWRERFNDSSAVVDSITGGIFFEQGEHWQAFEAFQNAANLATTLTERRRALFNAALSAVVAGNVALYQSLLGQLEVVSSSPASTEDSPESASSLELEKALHQAATRRPEAEDSLRAFVRAHPSHPRFAEACVALAEWQLMNVPPQVEHARTTLDLATTGKLTPEQRQQVDSTRLWLREAAGDLHGVVTEGTAFLKAWPKSRLLPEVRLRIASAYYRQEDFASARTEFEIIARDHPGTPHAETALYFAAMSAGSVMSPEGRERAQAIWEELASRNGPLAVAARRQQAISERSQGRLPEALATLDKLLAIKPLDAEQRRMTLCEKAEVLLLLGKSDRERLKTAVSLLQEFLKEPELSMFWKARAGFTLANVYHDAGSDTEALEACYNVLRAADVTPPTSPADYVWFAKAGFFGVDLLEAGRQWEAAARLAEQISQRQGNRASEAKERATKIRLDHFLWDGPAPTPPRSFKLEDKTDLETPPVPAKPAASSPPKKRS